MRIATWNVNSVTARLPRLLAWLESSGTDVLCVQETKCTDGQFPHAELGSLGYEAAVHADGRWNGVAVLSRVGLADVVRGLPGGPAYEGVQEPRAVAATCGPVRVWSVYVPNGREVGHPHYDYKLRWLDALRATVKDELRDRFVVLGDFNIAPTDDDVWDASAVHGATHVSEPERSALRELRELGLSDVVPRALKHGTPYTYWDYRAGMFHKNLGMRIDLVYATSAVAGAVSDAYVDREARKGTGPSDHAPVVVDLEF